MIFQQVASCQSWVEGLHPLEPREDHLFKKDGGEREALKPEFCGGHVRAPLRSIQGSVCPPVHVRFYHCYYLCADNTI